MHFLKDPLPDHIVQICLHILKHKIQVFQVLCLDGLLQLDDIVVRELAQNAHFPVSSLSVCCVLEGIENLFQGINFLCGFLLDFPDVPIGP